MAEQLLLPMLFGEASSNSAFFTPFGVFFRDLALPLISFDAIEIVDELASIGGG